MSPEELLPQIQSEEPVTGKGFIALSQLHNVLGHDGVPKQQCRASSRGCNRGRKKSGQNKVWVCDIWPPSALSFPILTS